MSHPGVQLLSDAARVPIVAELRNAALIAALSKPQRPEPPTGTDGEQACQHCAPLHEQIREYKAADELMRHGPFTPDGAQVHKQIFTIAESARRSGKEKRALERSDVARLALGDPSNVKAVSRALKAYTPYQDDPEPRASLPYRLVWREAGRKTHIDLYPLTPDKPQAKDQQYRALARLPKDRKPPAKLIKRDDGYFRSCRPSREAPNDRPPVRRPGSRDRSAPRGRRHRGARSRCPR